MRITTQKRKPNPRNSFTDPYYQTREWRQKRDQVWKRDQGLCQQCKDKGKFHPLTRHTKDLNRQGTVDHIIPRNSGGSDELSNLRLVGSRCHAVKSAKERKNIK